jgi:hypothetical protein
MLLFETGFHSPGWLQTHDSPASVSQVPG